MILSTEYQGDATHSASEYYAGGFFSRVFTSASNGDLGGYSIANGVVIENAAGGAKGDLLVGNTANNMLEGNGGNDALFGFDGNDTLKGGEGDDEMTGGDGDDRLEGGAGYRCGNLLRGLPQTMRSPGTMPPARSRSGTRMVAPMAPIS